MDSLQLTLTFNDAIVMMEKIQTECTNIIINSKDTELYAENLSKQAKTIEKLIEDRKKLITKPILEEKKRIDDFVKSMLDGLVKAQNIIRNQLLAYKKEQERIRQEELRRIEEEKLKIKLEQERIEKEKMLLENSLKHETGINDVVKRDIINKVVETTNKDLILELATRQTDAYIAETIASQKTNGIRLQWTFDIVAHELIPLDYMIPDEKAINFAIKNGVREIPGIKIYQKEVLVIR